MPVQPTYPGVYVEEIPSGVRTIVGVATSITAFIGRAKQGPPDVATTINTLSDFEEIFGGLWLESSLGYAVRDFYGNGGKQAIIVRLFHSEYPEETRKSAEDAAKAVADAAGAGADAGGDKEAGKNAQAKAKEANDGIQTPPAGKPDTTPETKKAASRVAAVIAKLPDDANKEAVHAVVDPIIDNPLPSDTAKIAIGDIKLVAASPGASGANLRGKVDLDNITDADLFNLTVTDASPGGRSERFLNLSLASNSPRQADKVLQGSKLVRWDGDLPASAILADIRKAETDLAGADNAHQAEKEDALWKLTLDRISIEEKKYARAKAALEQAQNSGKTGHDLDAAKQAEKEQKAALDKARRSVSDSVTDGAPLEIADFLPPNGLKLKKGLYALEQADLFNLLCIPPYKNLDVERNLLSAAAAYCEQRRAMLIVDPLSSWTSKSDALTDFRKAEDDYPGIPSKNAALFFPRLVQPDPLRDGQMNDFVPCGAVAGVFARTDVERGVWKAPAGIEATLAGVPRLKVNLTDAENGELNPLGINCLRAFPLTGRVVWGARTLVGADQLASEWKYIPVRRTALFIEESLYRGTKWVVFEPNDEPLWAQIRLNIGAFMHNLFRQGAFQGKTPQEAYLVKCDKETTPQNDIDLGIVNILVGFAPLKPAEFVIIKIQQMAGQIEV